MKTPTQLAEAVIARDTWREWDYDAIRDAIAEGIEADRAQRDPNPVLEYYRSAGVPDDWEQDLEHLAFMHTPEHIDHARKVLEELSA